MARRARFVGSGIPDLAPDRVPADRIRTRKSLEAVRELKTKFTNKYLNTGKVFSVAIRIDPATGRMCLGVSGTEEMLKGVPTKYHGLVVLHRVVSEAPVVALHEEKDQ